MKHAQHLTSKALQGMPETVVQSVEDYVKDIVADQAIEGYRCTPDEIARLTEKVKKDHADDIAKHGGITTKTLRSARSQPPGV